MTSERMIFIVDHDAAVRASVATLAGSMGVEVLEHESAEDFLAAYDRAQGGCLILATRLPGMSGLDLMDVMVHEGIYLPTIIVSAFADVRLAVRAMHAGAVTVLDRPYRDSELWEAIREALALDSRIRQKEAGLVHVKSQLTSLKHDEHRVLELILVGKTNKGIAQELGIRLRTVEARRHALMVKLNVDSLAALIQTVTEARMLLSASATVAGHLAATQRFTLDDPVLRQNR